MIYKLCNNIDHVAQYFHTEWLVIQNSQQIQSLWCTCCIMFLAIYLLTFREKDCNITIEIQLRINQNYSERRNIILFVQQWIIFSFVDHVKAKFLKRSWIIYTRKYVSTKNVKITEELLFYVAKAISSFYSFLIVKPPIFSNLMQIMLAKLHNNSFYIKNFVCMEYLKNNHLKIALGKQNFFSTHC